MTEWVSIKDGLPPEGDEVLTYSTKYPEDGYDVEVYLGDGDWSTKYHVSHWQPIEPPKSDETT